MRLDSVGRVEFLLKEIAGACELGRDSNCAGSHGAKPLPADLSFIIINPPATEGHDGLGR